MTVKAMERPKIAVEHQPDAHVVMMVAQPVMVARKIELNSNIITDCCLRDTLIGMVPEDPVKFKLLYRGSEHGFSLDCLHKKCDGLDPTLIIIHSSEDRVFGGFTDLEWQSKGGGKKGNSASFIFSLREDN